MENAIYQSMLSAVKLLDKQAIIANNLANISTTGFKESFDFFIKKNNQKNFDHTLDEKIKKYYNFSSGNIQSTQNNLDLIVKNNGWLVIKDSYGKEAYTKNGHLQVNEQGDLSIQGYEVVGRNGAIKIPNNADIKILPNGVIEAIKKNKNRSNTVKIGSLKLVVLPMNHLIQSKNGLFYIDEKSNNQNIPHSENINVQSGMLEESNVNSVKNMIDMISNARQYEMNMKIISVCDQNEEYANQLFNITI